MRELAVQSANDTLTSTERGLYEFGISALSNEIDRISKVTNYNARNCCQRRPTGSVKPVGFVDPMPITRLVLTVYGDQSIP